MRNFEEKYINWAHEAGVYEKSTANIQAIHAVNEIDKMDCAVTAGDRDQVIDSIGRAIVHLTHIAFMNGSDLTECMARAWDGIEKEKA